VSRFERIQNGHRTNRKYHGKMRDHGFQLVLLLSDFNPDHSVGNKANPNFRGGFPGAGSESAQQKWRSIEKRVHEHDLKHEKCFKKHRI